MSKNALNHTTEQVAWRDKLLVKAGLAAGVLALATVGTTSKVKSAEAAHNSYAPSVSVVGFTSSEMFTADKQTSEDAAGRIQASGANTVRIIVPYTTGKGGQAEIVNDTSEYCNAAQAAYDHKLDIIWAFDGFGPSQKPKSNGQIELGHIPESSSQIKRFLTTLDTIMWSLAKSPDSSGQNGGCEPAVKNFNFEPFNEVNSPTFNQNQDSTTPYKYMNLLSKIYPAIKTEAKKPDLGTNVHIIAGALAASHDAPGFTAGMAQAKKDLGISYTPFDEFSYHPYAPSPDGNPQPTERALYLAIKPIVDNSFDGVPILLDEVGVNSQPPISKRQLYGRQILTTAMVGEARQAQYYNDFYSEAACEPGVIGAMTFQLTDDGKGWSSGLYYPDKTPKSSLTYIQNTQRSALDGTLSSC